MEKVQIILEVERVTNLVKAFGWDKIKEEIVDDTLIITFQKKMPVTPPAPAT